MSISIAIAMLHHAGPPEQSGKFASKRQSVFAEHAHSPIVFARTTLAPRSVTRVSSSHPLITHAFRNVFINERGAESTFTIRTDDSDRRLGVVRTTLCAGAGIGRTKLTHTSRSNGFSARELSRNSDN